MDSDSFRLSDIKVTGSGFRSVAEVRGHTSAARNKNTLLLDPASNTRIAYRILNPEDLNLRAPVGNGPNAHHKKPSRKVSKPKATENRPVRAIAVTRSGRRVRPPRDAVENEVAAPVENIIDELESSHKDKPLCARIVCPVCRKAYRGFKRMGRHLLANPTHAVNERCKQTLEKYQHSTSESGRIDASTQTDSIGEDEGSLLDSLSRILRNTPADKRASAFANQLGELASRLRRLLPSLMCESEAASPCLIDSCVGKILDVAPGQYRLNASALAGAFSTKWIPVGPAPEWTLNFDAPARMRDPVLGSDSASPDLLGTLEADCLSFSDSRSSQIGGLDLQLELFPFHHSQCE